MSSFVSQIGLVARSPEGHAAKGMPIKGHEDLWIDIQANTFRNWINEHLKSVDMRVINLASDFADGTKLCALVEVLQKRVIKPHWNRKPNNQHQYLENVSCALNAIAEDGVKLVNIGNIDIVNGNLKLILGLIWSLIVRYQIGPSKFPPKKLMLAWLKAVLPDCNVNNLTSDWNSGVNLSALLDYCQPGLFPNWRELDPSDSIENCRTAMEVARQEFNVPMVLEPEYLASPFLDELSGMTYLSYFLKEDSPGFKSTLRWVNSRLKNRPVRNFTTDWNDGRALCTLVKSLGGSAKYEDSEDPSVWLSNLNSGIHAGRRLGVDPILSAKDMVNQNVEHLGVMAYAASFQWIPPRTHPSAVVNASSESHTTRVYQPTTINLDFSSSEVNLKEITAEIIGPECNKVECRLTLGPSGGRGTFVPMQVGMHKIIVYNEEEVVRGCPLYIRALPELTSIKHTGLEPCAVGSIVEVIVNSNGAKAGLIEVTATSPTGRELLCPVHEREGIYRATFEPDEPGEWSIAVRHSGELIEGGPFPCFVFDPNGVELIGLDKSAVPEGIFNFTLDARGTGGLGNIVIDIVYNKQSLPHTIDHIGNSIYRVSLHTRRPGKYKLYIYFNGNQIKGSPFPLRVGTKEQMRVERQSSFSKNYNSYNNYEFKEENSSDSFYHRISSPSRSPSHSPSPLLHSSSPVNVRNSESTSVHKSAFKVTSNSSSKMVDSLLRSRLSPINNSSDYSYKNVNSSSSMQNSSYKNGRNSPSSHVTKHNSTSNNHSVKYLNTSSSIRMSPSSPTAHFKSFLNSNSKSSTPVNGHAPDIKVTGDALHLLPIHKPSTIYVHTDATLPNVLVTVTSPSNSNLPVRLSRNVIDNVVSASFTPVEIGEHAIDIKIRDERIAKSPFRTHVYNSLAIKVGSIPDGYVGQAVEFEIDGSGAGSGNLEILVNGGHVTSFVRNLGNQRFLASFVPHEPVIHKIDMKFNNEPVIGSPWEISVMPSGAVGPKMTVIGEAVRQVPAGHTASFQISAMGFRRSDLRATVMSPSKRNLPTSIFSEGSSGVFRIEFIPTEVGSHLIDVSVAGDKLIGGPLVAKVYNTSYIHVTDVKNGVVGQPCQFKVDASEAGEGQLEISINEGEVPNHVTVVGGGRCLVSFTPEQPKPHLIDIKFNGETVSGCPFVCSVSDTSRVSVNFSSLELIPVNQVARFHMTVDNSASAELSVSVTGPTSELPVKVTGNVHSGFTAEFTPQQTGSHTIAVDYNGHPIYGTPFVCKVYDAKQVIVGNIPKGHVGNMLQFTVDASQAGEGNLEITISARGSNIPTQVHPQRNVKFNVSFVPIEPTDHIISIHFNKEPVPGSPFIAQVSGNSPLVNGAALNSAPVGTNSYFTMSNVSGNLEDIEVNVEGPNGQSVPALVKDNGKQTFNVEFCPKFVGEHKIGVSYKKVPVAGSPFSCKVYDVNAIKVTPVKNGVIGQPVTFIIETSQAGPGNLEVTVNGGRVPTTAQGQGPHTYAISFTPRQAVVHTVDLRFNGKDVPGSPFTCSVSEAARVVLSNEDKVSVDKPAKFVIECEPSIGTPKVQVLSPTRIALPVQLVPLDTSGRFSAQFVAKDVGDHSVEVKINGNHVEGSPFLIKAYDASKVRVTDINSGIVDSPVYFTINASQAGAGNLEIIVSVNGCNVPNYVQSEGNAKFKVNFKPREAAPHNLSVRFNGEPVPGSPFTCKIIEGDRILASENELKDGRKMCHVGRLATINIDSPDPSTCKVIVTAPNGRQLPVNLSTKVDSMVCARFTPVEIGHHVIDVDVGGSPLKGSPFTCNVYNIDKIKVTGLGTAKVGKPVTFSVDATEAGEGTLELVISTEVSTVKAEVVACSRGLYDVTFVPHQILPHYVNISFNEETLPGSPFRCDVIEIPSKKGSTATARGEGLTQVILGSTAYFEINPHSLDHGQIEVQVLGPDGKTLPVVLEKLESGLFRVKYKPTVVGNHTVTVLHRKQPISKHPWNVQVFDPTKIKIFDRSEAFCNQPASFKVDTRGAGSGALTLGVKAATSEVKHTLHELDSQGIYQVIYHPAVPIPHRILVKYNNVYVPGSPLEVPVSDPAIGQDVCAIGMGLYQSRANHVTSFVIYTAGYSPNDFDVIVTGPQGTAIPVRCYQQKDGNLLTEFTAASTGVYKIEVMHGSRQVRGSPFMCQVFDASKIKIENIPNSTVSVNDNITFKLIRKNAGLAELDVTVRSPLGQDLPIVVKSIGQDTDLIELCPTLPGNYGFHITYGGDSIPDSPLTFTVVDSGFGRAWGPGLSKALVDTFTKFFISARSVSAQGKPVVQITSSTREPIRCSVVPAKSGNEGEYEVSFTPDMVGTYDIDVMWNGKNIPGSPFHCFVVNINRVKVVGDNPLSGKFIMTVNTTTKIIFDVSQAGPGELVGTCEAPHGTTIPVNIEHLGPDTVQCSLTPRNPGPHSLSLLYGGFPLPESPFHGLAESTASGVRVILTGKGLASAICGQQAEFTVDGTQAGPGVPEVTLTGVKHDIEVSLQNIGDRIYKATYTPTNPGAYLLNVMWSDRQVKGCPLKVTVNAVCDASKVLCTGDGLGIGTVGKDIRSFIDTRRAGPGELSAHCVGPHKVAYCELYDHGDGTFTLNVKPQEPGKHTLTVKYGGVDVPGSPFILRVSGAPDPSKVRVYGPGIEHGVLAMFQSRFICDTRGAGAGQLTVRVRGPKGAFRVEMQRESQKDRTILCKYDPTEPGDYRVEVKWAGEHVPGSPFMVMIFDTQQELNRFLQGSPASDLYGSVAYSTGYAHITP